MKLHNSSPLTVLAINLFVFGSISMISYSIFLGFDKIGPVDIEIWPFDIEGHDIGILILRSQHPFGFLFAEAILLITSLTFYSLSIYIFLKRIGIRFIKTNPPKR